MAGCCCSTVHLRVNLTVSVSRAHALVNFKTSVTEKCNDTLKDILSVFRHWFCHSLGFLGFFSKTLTLCPSLARKAAALKPENPLPMTDILLMYFIKIL